MNPSNVPTIKQIHKVNVNDYRKQMRNFIMTSRFNNNTWEENAKFRETQTKIGCIYCSPNPPVGTWENSRYLSTSLRRLAACPRPQQTYRKWIPDSEWKVRERCCPLRRFRRNSRES